MLRREILRARTSAATIPRSCPRRECDSAASTNSKSNNRWIGGSHTLPEKPSPNVPWRRFSSGHTASRLDREPVPPAVLPAEARNALITLIIGDQRRGSSIAVAIKPVRGVAVLDYLYRASRKHERPSGFAVDILDPRFSGCSTTT